MPKIRLNYIYVFFVPRTNGNRAKYWYRAKIGVSDNVTRRRGEIQQSLRSETGRTVFVKGFGLPFLASYSLEGKIHRATNRIKAKMAGSGKTEWRYFFNIITALLAGHFGRELDFKNGEVLRFFIVALIPLPLDYWLLLLTAFAAQIAIVCVGLYFLLTILKFLMQLI